MDDSHALLPGKSAWKIQEIADHIGWVSLAVFFISLLLLLFEPTRIVALVISVVAAFPASIAQSDLRFNHSRIAAEVAAGYVTVAYPHFEQVDLVNPKTGEVVRPAGAPAISPSEFKVALRNSESRKSP